MSRLQSNVPDRIENPVDNLGQIRQRFGADSNLAIMQKHEIYVAMGIEFCPAITAEGDQGHLRKLLLCLLGQIGFGGVP